MRGACARKLSTSCRGRNDLGLWVHVRGDKPQGHCPSPAPKKQEGCLNGLWLLSGVAQGRGPSDSVLEAEGPVLVLKHSADGQGAEACGLLGHGTEGLGSGPSPWPGYAL